VATSLWVLLAKLMRGGSPVFKHRVADWRRLVIAEIRFGMSIIYVEEIDEVRLPS
jgi:hypothetical protein